MKYRIKELRESKGITQEALAELTGIARTYLSAAEFTDTVNLTAKNLVSLSAILNCTVDDLILREPSEISDKN